MISKITFKSYGAGRGYVTVGLICSGYGTVLVAVGGGSTKESLSSLSISRVLSCQDDADPETLDSSFLGLRF